MSGYGGCAASPDQAAKRVQICADAFLTTSMTFACLALVPMRLRCVALQASQLRLRRFIFNRPARPLRPDLSLVAAQTCRYSAETHDHCTSAHLDVRFWSEDSASTGRQVRNTPLFQYICRGTRQCEKTHDGCTYP